ncbi:MAG: HNH endonuclease [Lachnospiraceae bacterium]|nr:HNH endonuclease [Lachnospiraceae bacterium]
MELKKYCAKCGCNRLIDITKTYCNAHERTKAESDAEYDRKYRDKKAKAFYNSSEWKTARAAALARDTGIDVYLYITEGRIIPATIVHHIVELREDYTKRSTLSNLISVSEETHEGTIKKAYSKVDTKRKMQQDLRRAVEEYQKKVVGG